MASKVAQILEIMSGTHCMQHDPLGEYYDARAVCNAGRVRDWLEKYRIIQGKLKNYRLMVSCNTDGRVRIFNPVTKTEFFI